MRDGTVSGDMYGDRDYKDKVTFDKTISVSPGRYYLEEFFAQRPGINADVLTAYSDADATAVANTTITTAMTVANKSFEILGTSASTDDVTFDATNAGLLLTTDGADNDQIIILPHLNTNQTAWTGIKWGTENQVIWEGSIKTGASIATALIWAGLKLTNTPTVATDDDQVFFRYSTDDSDTTWQVESSIAGTDTSTSTSVTVAVDTTYRFRIEIDSERKALCYINDVLVYKTAALTNDVDLIPYIGLQSLSAAADTLIVNYEKISRMLFE